MNIKESKHSISIYIVKGIELFNLISKNVKEKTQ